MDYNKVFELGPWPMNLLLCIFEENDWDVLKKKLPRDYRGTLEYMLLTRFGQRPAEIIRMVFQEGLSVYDVAGRFDRDLEGANRMIEAQVKRLRNPYFSWFILHGVSGEKLRAQAESQKAGYGEGFYEGYQAAIRDIALSEEDKYTQAHCSPEVLLTGDTNVYVSNLRISMRTHNILARAGYKTATELSRIPFDDLLKISGVGITTAKEIAKALREAGFVYYGGEDE